jgi:osmotically-inducible protein OsmY
MIQTTAGPTLEVAPTRATTIEATRAKTPDVAAKAVKLLRGCSHAPVRHVRCRFQEGVLILSGQVPTFYMKQVAQELLRNMKHVEQIDNRLSVPE